MFADVSRHRSTDDAQILFEEKRMEKFASERFQKPGYERKLFWSAPRCTKSRSLVFFFFFSPPDKRVSLQSLCNITNDFTSHSSSIIQSSHGAR